MGRKPHRLTEAPILGRMRAVRGSLWGPPPMPEFLTDQLAAHGFAPGEAGRCAALLAEHPGPASTASLFVDLGSSKFLEGDIDGAIASWRHAISSPHDAAAARGLLNLGLVYEHLHLSDRAVQVLESVRGRGIEPYVEVASLALARCQSANGDTEEAMDTIARLAHSHMQRSPEAPAFVDALYALGDLAMDAGRPDRAERSWTLAAAGAISPTQVAAHNRLIGLFLEQGREDQVLELLDRPTSAISPSVGRVLIDRVEALYRLDRLASAKELAAAAVRNELHPNDRFRLAELHLRHRQINDSIDQLEVLLASADDHVAPRAGFQLGEIYRAHGMADAAVSMFQLVVQYDDPQWTAKAERAHQALLNPELEPADQVAQGIEDLVEPVSLAEPSERVDEDPDDSFEVVSLAEPAIEVEADVVALDELEAVVLAEPAAQPVPPSPSTVESIDLTEQDLPAEAVIVDLRDDFETDVASAHSAVPFMVVDLDALDDEIADEPYGVAQADPRPVVTAATTQPAPAPVKPVGSSEQVAAPVQRSAASVFQVYADQPVSNPYAALAPEKLADDVRPSRRNPYAELAPSFEQEEPAPPDNVEAGDWQSMLPGWPSSDGSNSRAFSRYT